MNRRSFKKGAARIKSGPALEKLGNYSEIQWAGVMPRAAVLLGRRARKSSAVVVRVTDLLAAVLSERALQLFQVDLFIRSLSGGQGDSGREQFSANHVVQRAIDGIDRYQLILPELKS